MLQQYILAALLLWQWPANAVDFLTSARHSLYTESTDVNLVSAQDITADAVSELRRYRVSVPAAALNSTNAGFLREVLATVYHPGNMSQIRNTWRKLGAPESKLPLTLSEGMAKRLTNPAYRPNLRTLLFDFRYRQQLELLGHPRLAWQLTAEDVRKKLSELNPKAAERFEEKAVVDLAAFEKGEGLVFRLYGTGSSPEDLKKTAMGVAQAVAEYGAFDHDLLMSELSGLDVESIRRARRQIQRTGSVTFRYYHSDPNDKAYAQYFHRTFRASYSEIPDHVEGILSMETSGHRPLYLPGESIVGHRMGVERNSVIGKYNPGLVNFYLHEVLALKWTEYLFWNQYAPEAMAETVNVEELLPIEKITNYSELRQKLNERFPNGWVLKPVWGYATEDKIITDKTDIEGLIAEYLKGDFDAHHAEVDSRYGAEGNFEYMQEELKEHPHFMGWKLFQTFEDNPPHMLIAQERVDIAAEYRVEIWGGEILKGATVDRYSYKADEIENYVPSTPEEIAGAEAFARQILAKLPQRLRETPFGMDVARLKDGSYTMIESNAGGNSSFIYDVPGAQTGISAFGRFLKEYPAKLAKGAYTGGLTVAEQRAYINEMFARWGIVPDVHFKGVTFLEDRVELDDYPKRKIRPERWRLIGTKRSCPDLVMAR